MNTANARLVARSICLAILSIISTKVSFAQNDMTSGQNHNAIVSEILAKQSPKTTASKGTGLRTRITGVHYIDSTHNVDDSIVYTYNDFSRGSDLTNYELLEREISNYFLHIQPIPYYFGRKIRIKCDTVTTYQGGVLLKDWLVYDATGNPTEEHTSYATNYFKHNSQGVLIEDSMYHPSINSCLKFTINNGLCRNDSTFMNSYLQRTVRYFYNSDNNLSQSVRNENTNWGIDLNATYLYNPNQQLTSSRFEWGSGVSSPKKLVFADTFTYHPTINEYNSRMLYQFDSLASTWSLIYSERYHFNSQGYKDSLYVNRGFPFSTPNEKWYIDYTPDGIVRKVSKYHGNAPLPFESYTYYFETYQATAVSNVEHSDYALWPNPAFSTINLRYPTSIAADGWISIHDVMGRKAVNIRLDHNGVETIDITHLNDGLYFYRLYNNNSVFTNGKFVKETR